jgi:hypothetical protein
LGGPHRFPRDLGVVIYEHNENIGERDQIPGVEDALIDFPSIHKRSAGGFFIVQDIFVVLMYDLSVKAGEKILMEHNIVSQLTPKSDHRLRQGNDLLIDDQECASLIRGKVCITHRDMIYPSVAVIYAGFPYQRLTVWLIEFKAFSQENSAVSGVRKPLK